MARAWSLLIMHLPFPFGRSHGQLTVTLEASGGIRLATLPQAFAVHHWLRRGRGPLLVLVLAML